MNARAIPALVIVITILVTVASCQHRQDQGSIVTGVSDGGNIEAMVSYSNGRAMPKAFVVVTSPALNKPVYAVTDDRGFCYFLRLPCGEGYKVEFSSEGYMNDDYENVQILAGQTIRVNFVALNESPISVRHAAPYIDLKAIGSRTIVQYNPQTGRYEAHYQ